jgi:hypothetical protein
MFSPNKRLLTIRRSDENAPQKFGLWAPSSALCNEHPTNRPNQIHIQKRADASVVTGGGTPLAPSFG